MKVLVSGSAGFIGGYVVAELLGKGYSVVGVDNFSKYGKVAKSYDNHPNYRLVEGDCRDTELMTSLLVDCEHFIAGAALIAYSSLTDYELGIRPVIGMRLHLWLDGAVGAILLCLPVIFRIDAFSPLLMIAGIMLVLPLTTELEPSAVPVARRGRVHARPRRSHSE